jgi:hypothetical protein
MGRELRRVPLDFDWPIDKIWEGYVTPEELRSTQCPACLGSGLTEARRWVDHIARMLLMLDDDLNDQARGRPLHPYLANCWGWGGADTRPSPDIAELGLGLAGRRDSGPFGHDSIDAWRATEKIISAAGLDTNWGRCPACEGQGYTYRDAAHEAAAEEWEPTDPPTGEGWQVWETVSEGSPITPVFSSAADLIDHLVNVGAWDKQWSREAAEAFVNHDAWAPSLMVTHGQVIEPGDTIPKKEN